MAAAIKEDASDILFGGRYVWAGGLPNPHMSAPTVFRATATSEWCNFFKCAIRAPDESRKAARGEDFVISYVKRGADLRSSAETSYASQLVDCGRD